MNKARRKQLDYLLADLRQLGEDERDAYENTPESLRQSERGEQMNEIADAIENACSEIEGTLP